MQLEFYDYSTKAGQLELAVTPTTIVPNRDTKRSYKTTFPTSSPQPLPGNPLDPNSLRFQQIKSEIQHVAFRDLIKNEPDTTWQTGNGLLKLLGYGGPF